MQEKTSDKEGVRLLTEILVKKGIKRVVLSPGSRNAPLSMAFAREKRLEHFVVLDERSAAFFALGMVQWSGEPVALACTSGTAPLNYGPAIAEAYYQRLPLIVLTADRPVEWIDQEDCQTIRQNGLFANIIKASYQLPGESRDEEERWYADRLINDAVNYALRGRRGPIHINIPLREPLYGERVYPEDYVRSVELLGAAPALAPEIADELAGQLNGCPKVMILAGFQLPDEQLKACLREWAVLEQVVILTETPSNLDSEHHIGMIDRVLSTIGERDKEEFAPDLLITFGGSLISRQVKAFLRRYKPARHWSIDQGDHPADTFQALTTQIDLPPVGFFKSLAGKLTSLPSGYARRWRLQKKISDARHDAFARTVGWCDWKAFSMIWSAIPAGTALQLSNSTPVRYAQLFECPQVLRVDCNRGTSGIDGSTSTAVGAAVLNEGMTLFVTGDMSFLYDSNALWNKYITPRFKIIVMKNGGGGIFRFLPGSSEVEELEECFETVNDVDVRGFALLHHFHYFHASDAAQLEGVLPVFFSKLERPAILAVETPRKLNAVALRSYFERLKG